MLVSVPRATFLHAGFPADPVNDPILATLRAHDAAAADWLAQGFATALASRPGALEAALRIHFARTARKLGTTLVPGSPGPTPMRAGDLGRLWLLEQALERLPEDRGLALVSQWFVRGEAGEQASVLRALPHLPGPERFVALAIEACRTNAIDVFSAVACENPYPAAHFPAPAFAQMVLKAIFLSIPIARIVGLRARIPPELVRMVEDYGQERRAAGRPIPADVSGIAHLLEIDA